MAKRKGFMMTKCTEAHKHLSGAMNMFYEAKNIGELTERQADSLGKNIATIMSKSSKMCKRYE